jgi:sirohydrochlorin cobaltochelatase
MIGVVLVGHGSRLPQSKGVYEDIARKAGEKSGLDVKVGYMKHWRPTLFETINSFIDEGKKKIVIVPAFLLPGVHVLEDIPILLGLKEGESPEFGYDRLDVPDDVEILYANNFGADDRLAEVVVDRIEEVLDEGKGD